MSAWCLSPTLDIESLEVVTGTIDHFSVIADSMDGFRGAQFGKSQLL